jgi:hypothetical protein
MKKILIDGEYLMRQSAPTPVNGEQFAKVEKIDFGKLNFVSTLTKHGNIAIVMVQRLAWFFNLARLLFCRRFA